MSGLRIMGQMWDDNIVSFTTINIFFYCIQGSSRGGGGERRSTEYRHVYLAELTRNLREVSQCQEKAFSLMKAPNTTVTI